MTRAHDLGDLMVAMQDAPFNLCPQGNLIFLPGLEEYSGDLFGCGEEESDSSIALADSGERWFIEAPRDVSDLLQVHLGDLGLLPAEALDGLRFAGGVLTMSAAPRSHDLIDALLQTVKEMAQTRIQVECLIAPVEVLDRTAPEWRGSGPYLPADAFDQALLDERCILLAASGRSGQAVASDSKDIRALMTGYEVDQTGVIPVNNPMVKAPFGGLRLEVRPSLVPGDAGIALEMVVGRIRRGLQSRSAGSDLGELELPLTSETLLSARCLALPGKALVAGSLEGADGGAVLVRAAVSPGTGVRAEAPARERVFRAYDVAQVLGAASSRRWPAAARQEFFGGLEQGSGFGDSQELIQFILQAAGERSFEATGNRIQGFDRWILYSGTAAAREKLERILDDEIRPRLHQAAVDLELLRVPRPVLGRIRASAEGGTLLGRDWRQALEEQGGAVRRRRCTVSGTSGEVLAIRGVSHRAFLTDSRQVSGGTGFAIVMSSMPVTRTCGDGIEIRVRVDLLASAGRARLRLQGAEAAILEERQVLVRIPVANTVATTGGQGQNIVIQQTKEVELTLPRQAVEYLEIDQTLPLGRDAILRTSAGEGADAWLLIARVRAVP